MNDPETFRRYIAERNIPELEALVTRKEVEDRIINRVYQKTIETQKGVNRDIRHVIDADLIVRFYREAVIPLTKQGEIVYLLHRNQAISTFQPAQYKFNW
jgi:chorismate mutase